MNATQERVAGLKLALAAALRRGDTLAARHIRAELAKLNRRERAVLPPDETA